MAETKKLNYVIDVLLSLSLEELTMLKRLSDIRKEPVEETARFCMNTLCEELLNADAIKDLSQDVDAGTTEGA